MITRFENSEVKVREVEISRAAVKTQRTSMSGSARGICHGIYVDNKPQEFSVCNCQHVSVFNC